MATATFSAAPDNTTDASFQAWAGGLHQAILAVGWTQTADTGQGNPATAAKPAAGNTFPLYCVYQMPDGLGQTVYLRLDYGSGGSQSVPAIKVTVGFSTNGAGTINSSTVDGPTSYFGIQSATAASSYVSGGNGRLGFCLFANHTNASGTVFVGIERELDAAGGALTRAVNVYRQQGGNQNAIVQYLPVATTKPGSTAGVSHLQDTTTFGFFGDPYMSGIYMNAPCGPMTTQLGYASGDFTALTTASITIYGTAHTYLAIGNMTRCGGVQNNSRLAMRYD